MVNNDNDFDQDDIPPAYPEDDSGPIRHDEDGVIIEDDAELPAKSHVPTPGPNSDELSAVESLLVTILEDVNKRAGRNDIDEVLESIKTNTKALYEQLATVIGKPAFAVAMENQFAELRKTTLDAVQSQGDTKATQQTLADIEAAIKRIEKKSGQSSSSRSSGKKFARWGKSAVYTILLVGVAYGVGFAAIGTPNPIEWPAVAKVTRDNANLLSKCIYQAGRDGAVRCPLIVR
ncbi:hypothetical protein ACTU44_21895 (plasmid) [Thalassospira sp. SM2505]